MDSYCELKALPNPEIIQSAVVSALMQALHSLLPAYGGRIGLAFPAYGQHRTLGGIIRILGDKADMEALHTALTNHSVIQDYALLTSLDAVPDSVSRYLCYQRRQPKGNSRLQRMKKRHVERGSWSEEWEQAARTNMAKRICLPYVGLKSSSTQQSFLLFIERRSKTNAMAGGFNSYGLALDKATVPDF